MYKNSCWEIEGLFTQETVNRRSILAQLKNNGLKFNLKERESSLFPARSAHGTTPSEAKLALRPNRPPEVRDQTPGMPDLAFFSRTMPHRRRARVERARAPLSRGFRQTHMRGTGSA